VPFLKIEGRPLKNQVDNQPSDVSPNHPLPSPIPPKQANREIWLSGLGGKTHINLAKMPQKNLKFQKNTKNLYKFQFLTPKNSFNFATPQVYAQEIQLQSIPNLTSSAHPYTFLLYTHLLFVNIQSFATNLEKIFQLSFFSFCCLYERDQRMDKYEASLLRAF